MGDPETVKMLRLLSVTAASGYTDQFSALFLIRTKSTESLVIMWT
jgi:hypothetical protein